MSDPLPEQARKHAFGEGATPNRNAAQPQTEPLPNKSPVDTTAPKRERLPGPVGRYNELARRLVGGESIEDAAAAMHVDVKGCRLVVYQPWFKDLMLRQKEKQS